jgi:hypothetical protein
METIEMILRQDGTITERTIRERDLSAEQSVLDGLTAGVFRPVRDVMPIPGWGMCHASVGPHDTLWSVRIDRIPLHTHYRLVNGVAVPVFAATTELELPLLWQAPESVRLVFVVRTEPGEEQTAVGGNWLFACNSEGNGYRLPLPNLHDDCLLCAGAFEDQHVTASDCIVASLEQFGKSRWNTDLMRSLEAAQKFFRFRPTDETFETLPIEAADWTSLCAKVSTAIMDRVIL